VAKISWTLYQRIRLAQRSARRSKGSHERADRPNKKVMSKRGRRVHRTRRLRRNTPIAFHTNEFALRCGSIHHTGELGLRTAKATSRPSTPQMRLRSSRIARAYVPAALRRRNPCLRRCMSVEWHSSIVPCAKRLWPIGRVLKSHSKASRNPSRNQELTPSTRAFRSGAAYHTWYCKVLKSSARADHISRLECHHYRR
jgi:hypothetical protein